jgi:multidrug efflux pump subunit AcrA (membrane-fusion protein)
LRFPGLKKRLTSVGSGGVFSGKEGIAVFGWVRRHPIWSALIALVLAFIVYKVVTPTKPTYEYVAEPAQRGNVTALVSASGKNPALNTIKVGSEISVRSLACSSTTIRA